MFIAMPKVVNGYAKLPQKASCRWIKHSSTLDIHLHNCYCKMIVSSRTAVLDSRNLQRWSAELCSGWHPTSNGSVASTAAINDNELRQRHRLLSNTFHRVITWRVCICEIISMSVDQQSHCLTAVIGWHESEMSSSFYTRRSQHSHECKDPH